MNIETFFLKRSLSRNNSTIPSLFQEYNAQLIVLRYSCSLVGPFCQQNQYQFDVRSKTLTTADAETLNMGLTIYPPLTDDATPGQKKALGLHNSIFGFA